MNDQPTVFVVDDDDDTRTSLALILTHYGYRVETYPSAPAFLAATGGCRPGCLVLDVSMPGISGLELQERLARQHRHLPIIFLTGHGNIPMTVRALKRGAVDFLEKPCDVCLLLERIDEGLRADAEARRLEERERRVRARLELLTERERQVFDLLVRSRNVSNKHIARSLKISHRTVEVHRARIMRKLGADSLTDLLDLATGGASRTGVP